MKIDDKYKWLARDKDGQLFAYEEEPSKTSEGKWDVKFGLFDEVDEVIEGYDRYSFIKWSDETPTKVFDAQITLTSNLIAKATSNFGRTTDELVEETSQSKTDVVNKPSHYIGINGIDVIGFAEAQFSKEEQKGFYRINAIKYLTRYDKKGTPEDDLQKADFYLRKLIELNRS